MDAPAVRISCSVEGQYCHLLVSPRGGRELSVPGLHLDQIVNARKALERDFQGIRDTVTAALALPEDEARACLAKIRSAGAKLVGKTLQSKASILKTITDVLAEEFQRWESESDEPALVEYEAPSAIQIPLDIWPVGPRAEGPDGGLEELADQLLGFRARVRRLFPAQEYVTTQLYRSGRKPGSDTIAIKILHHAGLQAAREEVKFLKSLQFLDSRRRLTVRGPWPDGNSAVARPIRLIAEHLLNPTLAFSEKGGDDVSDVVLHFACHCYTDFDEEDDYEIELADEGSAGEIRLRMGDLIAEKVELALEGADKEYVLPMVFFNACGSSVLRSHAVVSWPRFFLQNRNPAFVGTEARVPDPLAASFSATLYKHLIHGSTLGTALVRARREMLKEFMNPLGILYSLYGDADFRLT